MANLSQAFINAWRSRRLIGANVPVMWAQVRKGKFDRRYQDFIMLDGSTPLNFASIPTGHDAVPWNAKWVPLGPWKDLPAVQHVQLGPQGFDNNGFQTATIDVTNVIWGQFAGVGGNLFHKLLRGILSPFRGFRFPARPSDRWWMSDVNEWHDIIDQAQIQVYQGYGANSVKVFTGLVDDIDMTSNPDVMTITASCFGSQALGGQRMFGWTKDPKLKAPVTFADRKHAFDKAKVGSAARASSDDGIHLAKEVLRGSKSRAWLSIGHAGPNVTEWVEVHIPKGEYEQFWCQPEWDHQEMFLSIYVRDKQKADAKHKKAQIKSKIDGVEVNEGWYQVSGGSPLVPGANGGVPYIRHWASVDNHQRYYNLTHHLDVGDNTVIRLSFRHLHYHPTTKKWHAAVKQLQGVKIKLKKQAKSDQWILVDDASGVVKTVLRWAGFREWEVEDFGTSLAEPAVFHQSDFLIDVINYMKSQGNFVFFIADPTDADTSLGVPTFRNTRALLPPAPNMIEVRDTDLLTGIQAKLSKTPKATIIRVRGAASRAGTKLTGGEDQTRRVNATYSPPWRYKMSELDKQEIHYDANVKTPKEAQIMAVLIAAQMALAGATGSIEIPGFPGIDLDAQVSVVDEGTSMNTRLWIASRSSEFTADPQNGRTWKTTLEGSLIDTEDIQGLAADYFTALAMKDTLPDSTDKTTTKATGGKAHPTATG